MLELEVECRTSRDATTGARHPITITDDWTLISPHDLDAERVAAAFGGYVTCLDIEDHALPALREAVGLLTRTEWVDVVHAPGRGWAVGHRLEACGCHHQRFTSVQVAAEHVRSVRHLSAKHSVDEALLRELVSATERSLGPFRKPPPTAWIPTSLVREHGGIDDLWTAGLHPDFIESSAALVPYRSESLPSFFYLGLAFRNVNRDWLARILRVNNDADVATWLAWSDEALSTAGRDDCAQWLSLDLPRNSIEQLLASGVRPATARALSAKSGYDGRTVAMTLANWARARCTPTAAHLDYLERSGPGLGWEPPAAALDLLEAETASLSQPPDRTELAVLLGLLGARTAVMEVLGSGVRTVEEAMGLFHTDTKEAG